MRGGPRARSGPDRPAVDAEPRPEVLELQLLEGRLEVAGVEPVADVDVPADPPVLLRLHGLDPVLVAQEVVEQRGVAVLEVLACEIGAEGAGRDAGLGPELEQRLAVLLERGPVRGLDEGPDDAAGDVR